MRGMITNMEYDEAAKLLVSIVQQTDMEMVRLDECGGRILAQQLIAGENVPAFDRSPYDGYAFRAEDTACATKDAPVVLQILEEIPAGAVPSCEVTAGTAVKILTGAPIPKGADAVVMYEKTSFTDQEVTIYSPSSPGDNIIYAGEDVKKGQVLAKAGTVIDPGLAGTLASQGIGRPLVYKRPLVGIISTGSELVDFADTLEYDEPGLMEYDEPGLMEHDEPGLMEHDEPGPLEPDGPDSLVLPAGKIRNSNRYQLAAALRKDGCNPVYLGTVGDDAGQIASLIDEGLRTCDVVILTGGVSAGDYDLTPAAMEQAGCDLLIKGIKLKPGMACCYGAKDDKLVCGLSGNPSSSLTNYYAVLRPAIRKMTGLEPFEPEWIKVTLTKGFGKKSKQVRILKGHLRIENGIAMMEPASGQGNVMISSSIGCDVMAIVPAGSGALEAGTQLCAFLV